MMPPCLPACPPQQGRHQLGNVCLAAPRRAQNHQPGGSLQDQVGPTAALRQRPRPHAPSCYPNRPSPRVPGRRRDGTLQRFGADILQRLAAAPGGIPRKEAWGEWVMTEEVRGCGGGGGGMPGQGRAHGAAGHGLQARLPLTPPCPARPPLQAGLPEPRRPGHGGHGARHPALRPHAVPARHRRQDHPVPGGRGQAWGSGGGAGPTAFKQQGGAPPSVARPQPGPPPRPACRSRRRARRWWPTARWC